MHRILLRLSEPEKLLPQGVSKFFGSPHVPEGFCWPQETDEEGCSYDLDFLCQINCAEAAAFDKDGLLPKTGILYFFYDLDGAPYQGDAAVLYCDGDLSRIGRLILEDGDGNDISRPELAISFEAAQYGGYAPGGTDSHFLLGEPSDSEQLGLGNQGVPQTDQMLLQIDSFKAGDEEILFGDTGTLCFFIKKKDLSEKNFGKTWYRICSY